MLVNWQEIHTVLLDMDGTLLDLYFDNHFWQHYVTEQYARRRNTSFAAAEAYLGERFRREQGTLNWYCVDYWSDELDLDIAALKYDLRHLIRPRDTTLAFLDALKRHHAKVLLVTNAHPRSLELKMEETGLGEYFDALVSSHRLHRPKEDPAFWAALAADHPFNPAQTLLIDDSLSVLHSARQHGIRWLLSIAKPDSQGAERDTTPFPALHSFDDIMPIPPAPGGAGLR
ncbi:MAG: GMP/IMP nucleotidase [Gammaproteobacteria bacterium]